MSPNSLDATGDDVAVCAHIPPRTKAPARESSIGRLEELVQRLAAEVNFVDSALADVRDDLQWVTRNGIPEHIPALGHPVLWRMAADPTAADWAERLEITSGPQAIVEQRAAVTESALTMQLRRLLVSLVQSPELTTGVMDEHTAEVVSEARQVLDLPDESGESRVQEVDTGVPDRKPARKGQLF